MGPTRAATRSRRTTPWLAGLLLVPLAACSEAEPEARPVPSSSGPTAAGTPTASPTTAPVVPTEAPAAPAAPEETVPPIDNVVSLPTLMAEEFTGSRIRRVRVVAEADAYTRSEVTYESGDTTVSGILLRPRGPGPFPGIVLNHGYIDPAYYVTGQGLAREQDYLARQGFAVLHTDYRGHAASDPAGELERESRLGYTRDAINAVLSLEREPYVDPDRMAMLGRSMGGGVTMNALVAQPGLVDAAVIYASVSSRYVDNLRQFTASSRPEELAALYDRFGTPSESKQFYDGLSPRTYFDRITEPVLSLHGTVDGTCPPVWARTTQRLMQEAGVDSRLHFYEGEDHAFYARWQDSIERSVRFIRDQFRAA